MRKRIYTTGRTVPPGYSAVNQEELVSGQKSVWREVISGRISACFPDRRPEEIKILDVGTGPGFFAIILAELGYRVTAVDYTASMLARRGGMRALAGRIRFRQMNAEELRFRPASLTCWSRGTSHGTCMTRKRPMRSGCAF